MTKYYVVYNYTMEWMDWETTPPSVKTETTPNCLMVVEAETPEEAAEIVRKKAKYTDKNDIVGVSTEDPLKGHRHGVQKIDNQY